MRALVLSGGGSKGAYQVGALQHLMGDLKISYDILCGVSVGAINASFLSMFQTGEEKPAIDKLANFWNGISTNKIYKRWFPFGRWHALWKNSFYDSSPLHKLIRDNLDLNKVRESGKRVAVGTVSLSSGKYTTFTQESDYFIDAVIASASFPGMLEPVKFMNHSWTDGGVKEISPIREAINMGADTIDVLMTSPEVRIKHFIENPTTVDVLKRCLDLSTDKIMSNDIEKAEMYNILARAGVSSKKEIKIHIIRPQFNLIDDLLDFDHSKILEMMQKGYDNAKKKDDLMLI
jgi:NTE family protein